MRNFILLMLLLLFYYNKSHAQCPTPITFSVQVTPETCQFCCDGSAQVFNLHGGCVAPYSITWQPGNLFGTTIGNICSGITYTVTITDAMGGTCCPSVVDTFNLSNTPTSIQEFNYLQNVKLFPNPSNGVFEVTLINPSFQQTNQYKLIITNLLGEVVQEMDVKSNKTMIDIREAKNGIYFIQIFTGGKDITTRKIIKQ